MLQYERTGDHGRPIAWGFEIVPESIDSNQYVVAEWFKTNLQNEGRRGVMTDEDGLPPVKRLFEDYLNELYQCIKKFFTSEVFGEEWTDTTIEFLFSFPGTWRHDTVESFRDMISSAGFDAKPRHTFQVCLPEAHASAIHAVKTIGSTFQVIASTHMLADVNYANVTPQVGDTLLVVDSGSGTTVKHQA